MKPKAGTEVFELIPSQKMINFMLKYSFFHKQVIQIPMSIVTSTPIDFDVLKKALNIEIERNDCMRLRFYKEHGEFYQYFLDKYVVDDVPVVTFSTEEEQQAYLTADARRPIRHLKGEDFRIIFFRSFDGGYGIYINITHLCMDAAAVFVFFSDLLGVYDHLKNGKPFQPILQVRHHSDWEASTSRMISAVCPGVRPTRMPTASRASFLSCAVPLPPETMAPAWPICLPSGAVNPAM